MEGKKYDNEKPRWELLPVEPIEEVVKVLSHGAQKYSDDNWVHVKPFKPRYYAAALRHIFAWWKGERTDPESGLHHLAHAVCCLIFLMAGESDAKTDI